MFSHPRAASRGQDTPRPIASRERGIQLYTHKEPNSANNVNELRS